MEDRLLSSKTVFEGEILTVRVDEIESADGHRGTREVVATRGAVGIVCVDGDELVLVKQYRHAIGETLLEICAGIIEPGEDPEAAAVREVGEEVGLRPSTLEHLVTYHASPGFTDHRLHIYLATDLDAVPTNLDPGEVIEIERRPASSASELIARGEVRDAKTVIGLALLALRG
ncbi:MAG: NUDIX hydrolase [Actinomycetota bacterium]